MVFRKPLSVGQVADVLHVSNKTVLNWIHAGALNAFTTYGGHYRVWPADLQAFLESSNMGVPFQFVDERQTTILILDEDEAYASEFQAHLARKFAHASVLVADDVFDGLIQVGEHRPHLLILNQRILSDKTLRSLKPLRIRKTKYRMKIMVLMESSNGPGWRKIREWGADSLAVRANDPKELLDSVTRLLVSTDDLQKN